MNPFAVALARTHNDKRPLNKTNKEDAKYYYYDDSVI